HERSHQAHADTGGPQGSGEWTLALALVLVLIAPIWKVEASGKDSVLVLGTSPGESACVQAHIDAAGPRAYSSQRPGMLSSCSHAADVVSSEHDGVNAHPCV
ncbi:hypothetical protein OC844_005396, partial [Tilletia horrida]